MYNSAMISVVSIVLTAGTACAMQSQQAEQRRAESQQESAQRSQERHTSAGLAFVRASDLLGMKVVNANDETLGDVSDAIVDRGSGQIRYLVLKSGGLLGMGADSVAIRMEKFSVDSTGKKLLLRSTPERIENEPRFDADEWAQLDSQDWKENVKGLWSSLTGDEAEADTTAYRTGEGKAREIKGTIRSVDRVDRGAWGEDIVVTVADGGKSDRVNLGPSWFVMSQSTVPMRGDTIQVHAFTPNGTESGMPQARKVTIDGSTTEYRFDDGCPAWKEHKSSEDGTSHQHASEGKNTSDNTRQPLVLLSKITSMPSEANNSNAGSIEDGIVELESGRVAMLLLDPDEKFLGMGDTTRLVPWSVTSIGEDKIRIDADEQMLKAAPEMPDDVTIFRTSELSAPVYVAYHVDVYEFVPMSEREKNSNRADRMRSGGREANRRSNESQNRDNKDARREWNATVEGSIAAIQEVKMDGNDEPMKAIVVQTTNGTKTVVLGTQSRLDDLKIKLSEGDLITVRGREMDHNGRKMVKAYEVTWSNGKTVRLAGR